MLHEFLLPHNEGEPYIIRTIFFVLVALYSLQFFTLSINTEVMNSFLHGPNLIFHEAGHVIFMPFGEFIGILGGTLGQCLMPIVVGFVFFFKESNPFGSSIALWWLGQSLTDVALYISDAGARSLPLIGGMSEEAHDWGNLLSMMDLVEYDFTLGIITHYIGMILMLLGLAWGGYILLVRIREEKRY